MTRDYGGMDGLHGRGWAMTRLLRALSSLIRLLLIVVGLSRAVAMADGELRPVGTGRWAARSLQTIGPRPWWSKSVARLIP
jgi:hypothetical protein